MLKITKQKPKFSKPLALSVLTTFGVIILAITYYLAYKGRFYNSLFWISVLLFSIPVFLTILNEKVSPNYKIILLFLFGLMLYVMRTLSSTIHFHFLDEVFIFGTTKLIYENGNLDVTTLFEIIRYYPGLELLGIFLRCFTNLDFFTTAKILIGLLHSFVLVFLYLFLQEISTSGRIAAIGTFIYATNPLYIFFHALFSYESLGIFFVILLLYLISKISKENSILLSILPIIILTALVITHHLSSYMFLVFIIFLVIIQHYKNIPKNHQYPKKSYLNFALLTATLIFSWMVYVAIITFDYLIGNFTDRLFRIFELSLFGGSKTNLFSTSLSTSFLPSYEFIIDTFLYAPLILLFSLVGVYLIKKSGKANIFIYVMIIYGPVLYFASLFLIPTSGQELAVRLWGFVFIGISLVVAIALDRLLNSDSENNLRATLLNTFTFFAVVLILIGGISIGDKPIHRVPDLLSPKLAAGTGCITTDVFNAAEWFERNFGRYNKMVGDRATATVFTGYGIQDVDRWNAWHIFFPETMNKEVLIYLRDLRVSYIIVDERITKSLAELGTYFSEKEKSPEYEAYGYGRIQPLPKICIKKFGDSNILYKTYDNGNINLYNVDRQSIFSQLFLY